MSVSAIIVAAGRGTRLGAATPKQLLDLGGRSMLRRSIDAFDTHPEVSDLIVVLPADLVADGPAMITGTSRPVRFVQGGDRRQDSVRQGLDAVPEDTDVVLVHDAARPFADAGLIDRVIAGAREHGAVLPAVPARDTVKRVDRASQAVRESINREEIFLAQTPQGFRRQVLVDAFTRLGSTTEVTDEAMLVERDGHPVRVVAGDERNVKITTSDDLALARAALGATTRVGSGYDLHRLVAGRPLVLAGIVVWNDRGPDSHSDGDVLCHSLVDAMLGAVAAGDIGRHFPNTDPAWKDAPGLDLLARAAAIVRERGWTLTNADATIILERPKLSPHVDAMRERLAGVLGVTAAAVSVKAKTNEGVDAVGRGEAIAAHAVAVLEPVRGRS